MNILKIILKVLYNVLFVLLLVVAGFIILTSYKVIKGYDFYVVMSGSMEPKIHTGSVVSIKTENEYYIGDVITSKMLNDPSQTYTHRIVNKESKDGVNTYTTKGDANESTDADVVSQSNVVGKVVISIPLVGYIVNFAKQPTGFIIMIVVPTIIILSSEINTIKEYAKESYEKRKVNLKERKDEIEN